MQWLEKVNNTQEVVGNATDTAGFPDNDPAKVPSSPSSSSSSFDSSYHSTGPVPGNHSNQYPHTNTNMAYQEGYRNGYRTGKKIGYNRACDDNRTALRTYEQCLPGRAPEQHPQSLPRLIRANGAVITTEELTREVASMMDRLGVPYKGTGHERRSDEIREFCNDVLLRLRAGEEVEETAASQENVPSQPQPQLKPKAQSEFQEFQDRNDEGSAYINNGLSRNTAFLMHTRSFVSYKLSADLGWFSPTKLGEESRSWGGWKGGSFSR
ncbi:hypothetical protein F4775DRAFT_541926 [Biscogniauxia sp. FL1348]|nr:hypothetical protein F4775DRAFT_541926 [Biscogniauxia sp. FL1348]